MGAANSSFLTCSGWDRYWLGWKAKGNEHLISARDANGQEVNGDIEATEEGREYILRDFATSGDAIRIKMPFIPSKEFQQWIWLENHQTKSKNDSRFDVYHYEDRDCVANSEAGLFAYMQIDANMKTGPGIYGKVNADYLRPITADGFYDLKWEDGPRDLKPCVNSIDYIPFFTLDEFENPLSGNQNQEKPFYTETESKHGKETIRHNLTRKVGDNYERMASFGHPRNGFRLGEKSKMGIGTNPSSASMLTLLNTRRPTRPNPKNNRKIYLSGLLVEILEELPDGSIRLAISFTDNKLSEDRRWCGPEIVLNNHNPNGADLSVKSQLLLDRGETMTRFADPDTLDGKLYFTDTTTLSIQPEAELEISGSLVIEGGSRLILEPGSKFKTEKGSAVSILDGEIIIKHGAQIDVFGEIEVESGSQVVCEGSENYAKLQKVVKPKKRLKLLNGR